ncbi:phosphate ABC transporter ATP-binding protein PstB [Vibrio cholerae]|uniref:phosphate ABC transporter ATP-binding protein PstB n=1 Tax=Vibrio cholerae TaxID=666 RepID=UPI0015814EB2|nr:phosphate ABC transporter ATP-binding protein PstB [Vibrio cholerae]EGR1127123.1 phosphate ABC transporter ATP-binding protein [Vibrio cholerae]EGR2040646.1 phosphate ABC transporter ATP-binding protein [Vibrio cholerae]EGR2064460.1 phosphate ABC transporter ATP-binding protein [Vibrio cholerae]EGR2115603.1 phosphate ABC transporter ATP-binding protein [Vibrio cholerae]EGR2121044.1 phosphate ABC transporter ATP-binding protein [Vibrio cholerae]
MTTQTISPFSSQSSATEQDSVKRSAAISAASSVKETLRAEVKNLNFWYGGKVHALHNVNLPIVDKKITALIGPSGCGKSTLLRSFNRMHDLYPGNRYEGEILLHPGDHNLIDMDPGLVRLTVGMVFQKPNPFPKSIYENVVAGLRIRGVSNKAELDDRAEESLRGAAIWDEVKDRLHTSAYGLSGGQQQRLCIARALAPKPDLLLLDEPTSALDPIATAKIEDLLSDLHKETTVVMVTHNMQQAARISHYTAYMHMGEMVEFAPTDTLFTSPTKEKTRDYITGRFG